MTIYAPHGSKDPIHAAFLEMETRGYQLDEEGREYYFQESPPDTLLQVYVDDEDDVIEWSATLNGRTVDGRIEILLHC